MYTAKEILVTFNETINGSEEIYRAVAKSFGLSDCAFWILYCIRQSEEKVTQKDICNFIYQPKQTVHSALKKMVEDGLIEVGDYNGKRHKYVTLTEKGEAFSQKTVDLVFEEEIAIFEDMDASEREIAMKLLAKYSDSLSRRMSKFR
ncbi:MAG: winged helix DNA-binding protein [Schaedlerella sp.]|uniref:MarR family winged helix-turn-helix transcriptional regulator n=1 Tax=Schaedlerella sp. TaxID=2676057 RepID=UPI00265FEDD1|nr:winged helix DNA-binding protein [uncultured Schaedlerella sp.]